MSIFAKTTSIVSFGLIFLMTFVYFGARSLVLDSYGSLESQLMHMNLQRFDSALQRELDLIQIMTIDWAEWDDTYEYMAGFNEAYEQSNIEESTFLSLNVSGIFYLDSHDRVVKQFGFVDEERYQYHQEFLHSLSDIAKTKSLLNLYNGIVNIEGALYMIASRKIVRSDTTEAPRGSLIMMRPFNHLVIEKLSDQTLLDIRLTTVESLTRALQNSRPAKNNKRFNHWSTVTGDNEITGVTEIYDVNGRLLRFAQIAMERKIYLQGIGLLDRFVQLYVAAGIVFIIVILWRLQKSIIQRLKRLTQNLVEIGSENETGRLVDVEGEDEIAVVAKASNQMLAGLERYYLQQRYDQEHQKVQNSLLVSLAKEPAIIKGDLNKAAHKIADAMLEGCYLGRASIWVFDEAGSNFNCIDCVQKLDQPWEQGLHVSYESIKAMVSELRRSPLIKVDNSTKNDLIHPLIEVINPKGKACSMLILAIKYKGQLYGFAIAENFQLARHFKVTEEVYLLSIVEFVEHTLASKERRDLEKELWRLASYDNLTEIPNRNFFYRCLTSAIEKAELKENHMALLYMDLDGFKPINDEYGHAAGDYLLKQTAKRISLAIRDDDVVARLGGDEFVVLLNKIRQPEDATLVAEKLLKNISNYVIYEGQNLKVSCSIGIALFPDHGNDPDDLVSKADKAMYQAKNKGANQHAVYREKSASQKKKKA